VNEGVLYLDSSAIIKLVFEELETSSLSEFLHDWPTRVSSTVASVEVLRTTMLVGDDVVERHARAILARVHLVRPDDGLLATAARVEPPLLRALDAIHLATALSLGHDLGGMVVYDRRLAEAARGAGLTVWSPR
jgi:predicted nucleic acid-binding protein